MNDNDKALSLRTDQITLASFLSLSVEEAFQIMAYLLDNLHQLNSYQEDVQCWYQQGVPMSVSKAVMYKRNGTFESALEIYDRLFQQMPTWSALYSSVYKVLAPAKLYEKAERAIQVNALLVAIKYTLSDYPVLVTNEDFALNPNHPSIALAFWSLQDMSILKHLGAISLIKNKQINPLEIKGYLSSIQGTYAQGKEPNEDLLQSYGKEELMKLPWTCLEEIQESNSFIKDTLGKATSDIKTILDNNQLFLN